MAYIRPVYSRTPSKDDQSRRPSGYEVRYRDGSGLQRTKGGFPRKRDAEAFAAQLESSRHQGTLIPHSRSAVLLSEVADQWLRSIEGRRKAKTLVGYEQLLDLHVRPAFGNWRVGSITYADVDVFVRTIEDRGRKPSTVRNAFFVLKMVLDFAIKDGRIRVNPCAGVELPASRSPEMLFLTATEVRGLAQTVDQQVARKWRSPESEIPAYGLLVEFAAFTGLRAGEIAALRTANLDLRAATLFVARSPSLVRGRWIEGEPKTKAGRRSVFINQALCDRLREHLGDRLLDRERYVFPGRDNGPLNYGSFYSLYFRPAVIAALPAHLHSLRFHDLRHTYASLLVEQGAHPKEMAELLGHASVQITLDRYSHVMPRLTLAFAERLDAAYRAAEPASLVAAGGTVANPVATLRPR